MFFVPCPQQSTRSWRAAPAPHGWRDWACDGRCSELCPASASTVGLGAAQLCATGMDGGGSSWASCAWDEVTLPGTQRCKQRCVVRAHGSPWLLSPARWGPKLRTSSGTRCGAGGTVGISPTPSAPYRGIGTTRGAETAAGALCWGSQPSPGVCRDALARLGFASTTPPLHPRTPRPSDVLQRAEPSRARAAPRSLSAAGPGPAPLTQCLSPARTLRFFYFIL